MTRRDRHDIVMEMLRKARFGRTKTQLMSDVSLSYTQAQQYLGVLSEKGMLETDKNHRFRTSGKGLDFLEKCRECILLKWEPQPLKKSR